MYKCSEINNVDTLLAGMTAMSQHFV